MDDRGDKIINLAREMLRSDIVIEEQSETPKITVSFKMLCLATLLTAMGSSAVTETLHETHRPLNRYEKTELKALVFYAARVKGLNEDSLMHEIEDKYSVSSFDDMTMRDFSDARAYLQRKAQ